jgi:histidinol-phosphatase
MPVITEAGGVFTSWDGAATAFGGDAIATNGVLAAVVRSVLAPERARPGDTGWDGGRRA